MADMQNYVVLFLIWLASTVILRFIFAKTRAKSRLPPGPCALPIVGHLHLLAPLPHQALHKLAARHGPLIRLSLGSLPCIIASSPDTARLFLKTHESSFANRARTIATDYLTYGNADFSFAEYGPYWKFMKKLCMSQLLGGPTLERFRPVRREEIMRLLRALFSKGEAGEAVDVRRALVKLTNTIISRMSFGRECCGSESEAETVGEIVAELTGKFNVADYVWFCRRLDVQGFGKRLRKVRGKFEAMMEKIMEEHEEARREKGEEREVVKDLLHLLLDIAEDDDSESEIKLTRQNIKAFILDIFAAGTDSSAITIEWALAELINHPNVMSKARKEIDSVVGKARLVDESDIPDLPYLQAIVKETLRLHPAGPLIVRESSENCTVDGYEIPAKTQLFINIWAIGRDPKHWDEPLKFKPERFLAGQGSTNGHVDVRGQHFHLLPFGSGRRGCPGTSLALLVVQASLAAMVQCFEWRVEGDRGKVDMEEGPGITLPRAKPLVCVSFARLSPLPL